MAKKTDKKLTRKLAWDEAYWHHRDEKAIADVLDDAECKRTVTGIV